jgi:hypothetical protein
MIATTPTTVPRTQASQELDPIVAIPKTNGTIRSSTPSTLGAQSCQRLHVFIVFISTASFVLIALLQNLSREIVPAMLIRMFIVPRHISPLQTNNIHEPFSFLMTVM